MQISVYYSSGARSVPKTLPKLVGFCHFCILRGRGMATHDIDTHDVDPQSTDLPQVAVTHALAQARRFRHHRHCRCMSYARLYCTAADALWSRAVDRNLDLIGQR